MDKTPEKDQIHFLLKKLDISEKARKRMELLKDQNQQVLEKVNQELLETLKKLQETQLQLIQSEKMASLGQLIAGLCHEINTPAGAILSAVTETNKDYNNLLEKLIYITTHLNEKLLKDYLLVCEIVLKSSSDNDTVVIREQSKEMSKILAEYNLNYSRTLTSNLFNIGFNPENISKLIPLLKSEFADDIYQTLIMLGMSKNHLRDIQIGIQKIVNLVRALKLYSRFDQDEVGFSDLSEDILTTLTILNNRLKHGIRVIKEFEQVSPIRCYIDQLNQVWTNIINNAIDATGGKGNIIIRIKQLGTVHVMVEIEDDGPGIPEKLQYRIFESYFTTKPKGEGTGLGLSICKEIVERHRGRIEVVSHPGKTLFKVLLPIDFSKEKTDED